MKQTSGNDAMVARGLYQSEREFRPTHQFWFQSNFRPGFDYETSPLGAEVAKIIADTPVSAFTPSGDGYGDRLAPAGYDSELNIQAQAIITGTSAEDMLKDMDAWFAANL